MKKLIKKLTCLIKGHKWVIYETYYNGMTYCKCKRCNHSKKDYIWELM